MEKTYRTDLTCFLGDEEKESVEGTLMGVMMEAGCRAQELPFRHADFSIKEGGLERAMDAVRIFDIKACIWRRRTGLTCFPVWMSCLPRPGSPARQTRCFA